MMQYRLLTILQTSRSNEPDDLSVCSNGRCQCETRVQAQTCVLSLHGTGQSISTSKLQLTRSSRIARTQVKASFRRFSNRKKLAIAKELFCLLFAIHLPKMFLKLMSVMSVLVPVLVLMLILMIMLVFRLWAAPWTDISANKFI